MCDFLSNQKPIKQKQYCDIPKSWFETDKRRVAHEEACRDLDKSPEQLLVDIHDESLDITRTEGATIARALARNASLQLRIDKKAGNLNRIVFVIGLIGLVLATVSTISSCEQTRYTKLGYYLQLQEYQKQEQQPPKNPKPLKPE